MGRAPPPRGRPTRRWRWPGASTVRSYGEAWSRRRALAAADVVVDFTTPDASAALAALAAGRGVALVIGATGMGPDHLRRIAEAAKRVPVVRTGNFSLGVNMLIGLVAQAAKALPAEAYDIEVVEAHHRRKVDAPSGTALMLGEAAAKAHRAVAEVCGGRDGSASGRVERSASRSCAVAASSASTAWSSPPRTLTSATARDRGSPARVALGALWVAASRPASDAARWVAK